MDFELELDAGDDELDATRVLEALQQAQSFQRAEKEERRIDKALDRARAGLGEALGTNVNLEARTVYVFGPIDDEVAYKLFIALDQLDRLGAGDITVVLNSPGGEVHNGFAMYDRIKQSPSKVTVIGYGAVQSAAATILQAGDSRLLAPNARLMVHQPSIGGIHDISQGEIHALKAEMDAIAEMNIKLLKGRFTGTLKELRDIVDKETFMNPRQAVKLGLADGVLK